MTNIEAIQLILHSYQFERPVPKEVRSFLLKSCKRNLVFILKKFGKYGIITFFVINLLFLFKKMGISLVITKAYVLVVIGSVAAAGTVTAVSALTVKKYIDHRNAVASVESVQQNSIAPSAGTPSNTPESAKKQNVKPESKLKQLYTTYRHVEKVYLKDGSIVLGVILEKGNTVQVITPEGTLNILKDDIQSVEYLTPDKL